MTDNADRQVRKWAQKRNGDPLTPHDVVDLVFAQADDQEADHAESMSRLDDIECRLVAHLEEAVVRDRRITDLELDMEERRQSCRPLVEQLIHDEHERRHTAYVASLSDSEFQNRLVWFFASTAGKVVLVIVGLIAGLLLNVVVYGRP